MPLGFKIRITKSIKIYYKKINFHDARQLENITKEIIITYFGRRILKSDWVPNPNDGNLCLLSGNPGQMLVRLGLLL